MSKFKFSNSSGGEVAVDISKMKLEPEQQAILEQMAGTTPSSKITREQWEKIKDIKVNLGGVPGTQELIVRFDWTWVKIDERTLDFDELTYPTNQMK